MTLLQTPNKPMFPLPPLQLGISTQCHAIARAVAAPYTSPAKKKQAYLNTLAVTVASHYLNGLGIVTEPEASRTGQPQAQLWDDVAELPIPGWGMLTCRPVLAEATHCYIPPQESAGVLAVQFDADFRYATLVGFVATVAPEVTELPLTAFADFEQLLDQVAAQVAQGAEELSAREFSAREPVLNQLSDWLAGTIHDTWQELGAILTAPTMTPIPMRSRSTAVERGKVLPLGVGTEPVALVVWVEPTLTPELNVAVELWPLNEAHRLPPELELRLIDPASGEAMIQAQARGSDRLRFKFSGEVGDRFDVKVTHQSTTVTEPFVI